MLNPWKDTLIKTTLNAIPLDRCQMFWSWLINLTTSLFDSLVQAFKEEPFKTILAVWGAFSGMVMAIWGFLKALYKKRKARAKVARDFIAFLERHRALHIIEESEIPREVYGAVKRIRNRVAQILPNVDVEEDRKDLDEIANACEKFISNRDAFPGGEPQKSLLTLTGKQWAALIDLRNSIIDRARSMILRYKLTGSVILTWAIEAEKGTSVESSYTLGLQRAQMFSSMLPPGIPVKVQWSLLGERREASTSYGIVKNVSRHRIFVAVEIENISTGKTETAHYPYDIVTVIPELPKTSPSPT